MTTTAALTLDEAAAWLGVDRRQLQALLRALRIGPARYRPAGRGRGHPVGVWDAGVLEDVYRANQRWLAGG